MAMKMMKSAMKAKKASGMKKMMKSMAKKKSTMMRRKAMKKSVIAKGYKTRAGANRAVFEGRKMKTVSSYVGVGSSSVVMRYFNSWNIKTTSLNLKHLNLTTRLYSS